MHCTLQLTTKETPLHFLTNYNTLVIKLFKNMDNKLEDSTLEVPNDLRLSSISFPKPSTTAEELNEYLRAQLEQMKQENEALNRELLQKNGQLQEDRHTIGELKDKVTNYEGSPTHLASTKIVELNKKLREKTAEIEVYKTKCAKQEAVLTELKAKDQTQEKDKIEKTVEPDELKKLQDKLTHITNKWTEEKNHNLQLKNDLKRANKWLVQEVGDKFETLLNINNSGSSWRGRAQIICDLQQKNQELKEKLKCCKEGNKDLGASSCNTETTLGKNDKKLEGLTNENLELKSNYNDLKRKFEALKARCKVLENEHVTLKSKISKMSEVYDADQQTIAKLTSQLTRHNELKNESIKQMEHIIKTLEHENEELRVELVKEKFVSANMSKELLEKNDDIQILNKRIRGSRPPSSYLHRRENPDTKTISKLEVERIRLLELTEIQNAHLQEERNSHFKTKHFLRAEKQKCAKLEANLARLQLDRDVSRSPYSSKTSISGLGEYDIKDKLELAEENIKALTTRLEIEAMERKRDRQHFCKILQNCNCAYN